MSLMNYIKSKIRYRHNIFEQSSENWHKFFPRCEANITLQKGFSDECGV